MLQLRASWLHILVVLGLLITTANAQAPNCNRSTVDACLEEVNRSYGLKAPGLVFTKEQIQEACSPLLEAHNCVSHYFTNCVEASASYKPEISPTSLRQISICRFLLDRYIQHLDCYFPLNETYNRCVEEESETSFRDNVGKIMGGNRELQQEGCCNIHKIFECALAPTRVSCSPEAVLTLQEFIEMPLEHTITPICHKFNCTTDDRPPTRRGPSPELDEEHTVNHNDGTVFQPAPVILCLTLAVFGVLKL